MYIVMVAVYTRVYRVIYFCVIPVSCDQVNGQNMSGSTHQEAVSALKTTTESCLLVVSREVLVVMPSSTATPSPTPAVVSDPVKAENGVT